MNWREFWNADTPIYVNARHKQLHYALIARDTVALIARPDAIVLDHGSGEALEAGRVAAACGRLYLCDGASLVRERLRQRFGGAAKIAVVAPEEVAGLPDGGLDLVVANSLLQYLQRDEFEALLGLWRAKLAPHGQLVLADVIPPNHSAGNDVAALLGFAWRGGFLVAALAGLVRTALSDYRRLRNELGLSTYAEAEIVGLLREHGFAAHRRPENIGPNPKRMTIVATPVR